MVISGLASTQALIRMDLMMPLHMQIDAARCTAIPRPIHTLQAKEEPSSTAKPAHVSVESAMQTATSSSTSGNTEAVQVALLQRVQVPVESVRFVQIANPSPHHTVCFELLLELLLCLSSSTTLANKPSVWVALQNLWFEPMTLHTGHQVGTVETAEIMEPEEAAANSAPMSMGGLVPSHFYPMQQHQLTQLLQQYRDIFSRDDNDIGQAPVLKHIIETQSPSVWLPYHWQNLTV